MNQAVLSKLRGRIPEKLNYWQRRYCSGISSMLVHMYFHQGNISNLNDDSLYHIVDWGSAVLTHPFCDFVLYFGLEDLIVRNAERDDSSLKGSLSNLDNTMFYLKRSMNDCHGLY